MTLSHLKHLVLRVHEQSKSQFPQRKKLIAVMLGRVLVGIIILKDKTLGKIIHGIFRGEAGK